MRGSNIITVLQNDCECEGVWEAVFFDCSESASQEKA